MVDIELLKRLAEACDIERCADEEERDRNLNEFYSVLEPEDVAALIAENEEMARRIRFFELVHGGRASELVREMEHLRAEVRRLKILAGEDVPPLPEEFVGPMPENCNARLRRKIKEQSNG